MCGLVSWPDWPEFTESDVPADNEKQFQAYKRQIVDEYGEENIRQAWLKTCKSLEHITTELRKKGSSAIPDIAFQELGSLSKEKVDQLKEIGCFVIRGVIPSEEVTAQFQGIKQYVSDNKDNVAG
jgi:hypothetical protein